MEIIEMELYPVEARVKDSGWAGDVECACPLKSNRNWGGID